MKPMLEWIPGDFSVCKVKELAPIAVVLSGKRIGIFAVSTFNTDYILTKKTQAAEAEKALTDAGYRFK